MAPYWRLYRRLYGPYQALWPLTGAHIGAYIGAYISLRLLTGDNVGAYITPGLGPPRLVARGPNSE